MRAIVNINENWAFCKTQGLPTVFPADWENVNLPHTWNAEDGQDGGGDYFRGHGIYAKRITRDQLPVSEKYYLEINGANSSADVYWNGGHLFHHDGGYSIWRVELPDIQEENLLVVDVDNSPNETVYPQVADFTFYGGLYRNVNLVCVPDSHFDLMTYGTPGIKVTPDVEGKSVEVEVSVENPSAGQSLHYCVKNAEGALVAETEVPVEENQVALQLEDIHLWHGRKDPYLYTV
ncbi:MAG: glycoside hydrolase family 2 protein, partial [Lachnospiraceae bacterium]